MRLTALALISCALLSGCLDEELGQIVTQVTQVHHQGGGQVDLLFVVDSSFSMVEEQEALASGFDQFISSFELLQYDFRIAVTTMDVLQDQGRFMGEVLSAETPNLRQAFRQQAIVGVNGGGIEQGLQAARLALSDANLEGHDFLREGATLALIFVSDEDDQSLAPLESYLDFFVDRKGGDSRRVKVSAIAGPDRGGCQTASAGNRYLALIEQTGGAFESICQDDLGLLTLGLALSGFKSEFDLVNNAEADEPLVFVNGREIEASEYSFDGQRVRFADGRAPDDCSVVEIAYFTRDFVDTRGEPVVLEPEPAICQVLDLNRPRIELEREGCSQAGGAWPVFLGLLALVARRRRV